jgi:NAD(P)-dependent dehydrogenase (short-subunit alcohol dehydrogenase family)
MSSNSNYSFPNDASYVISGGLGGIGRSIAYWMVSRGARNLILLSRSGPDKIKKAQAMLAEMERQGVKVRCPVCDVADLASLHRALEVSLASMPPIKGCFQAAMVLRVSDKLSRQKHPVT